MWSQSRLTTWDWASRRHNKVVNLSCNQSSIPSTNIPQTLRELQISVKIRIQNIPLRSFFLLSIAFFPSKLSNGENLDSNGTYREVVQPLLIRERQKQYARVTLCLSISVENVSGKNENTRDEQQIVTWFGKRVLVENQYSWQCRHVPCLGTPDSRHKYVCAQMYFATNCQRLRKRLDWKKEREIIFLFLHENRKKKFPVRTLVWPVPMSLFQLPSVKYVCRWL